MPMDVTCSCGKLLRVADEFVGQKARCPVCGHVFEIPTAATSRTEADHAIREGMQQSTATPQPAVAESIRPDYSLAPPPREPDESAPEFDDFNRPSYKLYSPGQVALAAFLGGPVGAFFILTLNYFRLGKRLAASITLLACLLTTASLVTISIALPDSTPVLLISVPLLLVMWLAARLLQGKAYETHRHNHGQPASSWAAAGLGLLGALIYLGIFFGVSLVIDGLYLGQKVEFGGGEEIYYTSGATESEARALGSFLREAGYFDGRSPKSVRISHEGGEVVVAFVIQSWTVNDVEAQRELRDMGQQASRKVFNGRKVVIHLCDEYFTIKRTLR